MPLGGCELAPSQPEIRIAASAGKIHPLIRMVKDVVEVLLLMFFISIHPVRERTGPGRHDRHPSG
jgi:hypothetical protein